MMQRTVMLGLSVLAFVSSYLIDTPRSHAHEGAWCALYPSSQGDSENCGLSSFEMCREEIRGTGGTSFCTPNAWFLPAPANDGPRRTSQGRHHRG
jgi:hypothetical protein